MAIEADAGRTYTDFQGLADLRRHAREGSPEALRVVAKQFEAYLVQQLLRSGRDASLGEGVLENKGSALYQDMFDKQVALSVTEGEGLGIADLLVRQLGQGRGEPSGLDDVTPPSGPVAGEKARAMLPAAPATASAPAPLAGDDGSVGTPYGPSAPQYAAGGNTQVRFDTPQEFARALMPHARRVGAELNVDPRLLVAQAALETGWGKSIIRNGDGTSSHNLFNIKAHGGWDGPVAAARTFEYENGAMVKVRAGFRSYESFEASFRDYVEFLRSNPRYGEALQRTHDPEAFARALQEAGYATDPRYADKVMSIYSRKELATGIT